mmetsp:Transcript_120039/g.268269  ORF Transcript_120039/g.268269 Transcript_120039/m.268269 type:complete len:238 (-) Transcript_120039:248-961(-)
MAVASALAVLGEAIREEVQQAVGALREELEQERKVRQLLEQQVLKLQQSFCTTAEVSTAVEALEQRLEQRTALVGEEAGRTLRAAQRELEHRIESALAGTKEAATPPRPPAADSEAMPTLLTREIDRKLGTVLVEMDQRFGAVRADAGALAAQAREAATSHAEAGDRVLQGHLAEIEAALGVCRGRLEGTQGARAGGEERMGARIESLQTCLEQKIGMVQLDVDQLRQEVQQSLARG